MTMKLSQKAIVEFQTIYKQEYGIELSEAEALEKAIKLLRLFKVVYKPIKKTTQ